MTNGTDNDLMVIRYNTDGTLDAGFGTNGAYIYDGGNGDDHLGVGHPGAAQDRDAGGTAADDLHVEQLLELLAPFRIGLDDDDLVALPGEAIGNQATDLTAAVGPARSVPCEGEQASGRGVAAFLPSGVAPHARAPWIWAVVGAMTALYLPPVSVL